MGQMYTNETVIQLLTISQEMRRHVAPHDAEALKAVDSLQEVLMLGPQPKPGWDSEGLADKIITLSSFIEYRINFPPPREGPAEQAVASMVLGLALSLFDSKEEER